MINALAGCSTPMSDLRQTREEVPLDMYINESISLFDL